EVGDDRLRAGAVGVHDRGPGGIAARIRDDPTERTGEEAGVERLDRGVDVGLVGRRAPDAVRVGHQTASSAARPGSGRSAPVTDPGKHVAIAVRKQTTSEGTFAGAGGVAIRWERTDAIGRPRGVVLVSHGYAEHLGRYAEFVAHLASRGLAVAGIDHRGHG